MVYKTINMQDHERHLKLFLPSMPHQIKKIANKSDQVFLKVTKKLDQNRVVLLGAVESVYNKGN